MATAPSAPATIAPTEAEARTRIRAALDDLVSDMGEMIYTLAYPVADPEAWHDLRPSERAALEDLMEDVYRKGDELEATLVGQVTDLIVDVVRTFATRYPERRWAEADEAVAPLDAPAGNVVDLQDALSRSVERSRALQGTRP